MRNPPEFKVGDVVVRPAAQCAFEFGVNGTFCWIDRSETTMLAHMLLSMAQHSDYDPLGQVGGGGGESGQLAKL